jgi:hypothetical protein
MEPTEKQKRKLESWSRWGRKMAFLRQLHSEVNHDKQVAISFGAFYRLRNVEL